MAAIAEITSMLNVIITKTNTNALQWKPINKLTMRLVKTIQTKDAILVIVASSTTNPTYKFTLSYDGNWMELNTADSADYASELQSLYDTAYANAEKTLATSVTNYVNTL